MNRHFVVAALFLGIAACATSDPPSQESDAESGDPATPVSDLVFIDILEESDVAIVPDQDEVVCSMERRTGTHRKVRVCRSRSQIAKSAIEAKESFEVLRRSQQDRQ